jgi:hypothetical protein
MVIRGMHGSAFGSVFETLGMPRDRRLVKSNSKKSSDAVGRNTVGNVERAGLTPTSGARSSVFSRGPGLRRSECSDTRCDDFSQARRRDPVLVGGGESAGRVKLGGGGGGFAVADGGGLGEATAEACAKKPP